MTLNLDDLERVAKAAGRHNWTDAARQDFDDAFTPAVCSALLSRARDAERLEAEKSEWARIQIGNGMEIGRHIATLVALQRAARHLLDACYAADAAEELSMEIDGSLLDALKAFVPDDPEAWGKLSALNEGGPANG